VSFEYFSVVTMTKLLVASGFGNNNWKSVEIINLDENNPDLVCNDLPNLLAERLDTGNLWMGNTPIICGGHQYLLKNTLCNCEMYQNGSWTFTSNMEHCRNGAKSIVLKNSEDKELMYIVGGFQYFASRINKTETFDGFVWNSEHAENSPEAISDHCIVKINSTTLFVIGGQTDDIIVFNTYYYNAWSNIWTPGVYFINMFTGSFYTQRSQQRKKDTQVIYVFWHFWNLQA